MNAKQVVEKLESAIAAYQGDTGPVTWKAEDQGNKVLLIGTYDADTRTDPDNDESYLTDEPWVQYGGDAILAAAGLEMSDSGMDHYTDKWGDDVVSQWVVIKCLEEHYRIEQGPDNWEDIPEGDFETEHDAVAAMKNLEDEHGWRNLRVVKTIEDDWAILEREVVAIGEHGDLDDE